MSETQPKENIYDVLQDKAIFSRISGKMVEVVKQLPENIVEGKVLFDGITLYDGIEGIEDDIQQMFAVTKDLVRVNLEDYYEENHAYEEDGLPYFMEALGKLMTREEYAQASKAAIRRATAKYEKQRDEEIRRAVEATLNCSKNPKN